MDRSTIVKFMDFEEDCGLFNHVVDGFCVWAYCRFSVYMRIEEILNHQTKRSVDERKAGFKELCSIAANCTINNPVIKAPKADRLFFSHARKVLDNGSYKCIYTDDLANLHPERSVTSEFLFHNTHLKPAFFKRTQYLDFVDILPVIRRKAFEARNEAHLKQIRSICETIEQSIRDVFEVELGAGYLSGMAAKRYVWYKQKKKLLTDYILKVDPRIIIETVGYETNKMIINEIAKEQGITTVELQHGVIGKGHIAYNYKTKYPYAFLPDYLFVFSDYWKQTASYPFQDDKVVVTGYPYLEAMMEKYPQNERNEGDNSRIVILVISQPEYSIKLLDDIKTMVDSLNSSGIQYQLLYKLHPAEYSMDNSAFSGLEALDNVEVVKDTSVNLYSLFARADIQIGVTSTAIFEGLAYSLPTVIMHYEKTDAYMGQLCSRGYAIMCDDGEAAAHLVDMQAKGEITLEKTDRSVFFMPNALRAIDEKLTELVQLNDDKIR